MKNSFFRTIYKEPLEAHPTEIRLHPRANLSEADFLIERERHRREALASRKAIARFINDLTERSSICEASASLFNSVFEALMKLRKEGVYYAGEGSACGRYLLLTSCRTLHDLKMKEREEGYCLFYPVADPTPLSFQEVLTSTFKAHGLNAGSDLIESITDFPEAGILIVSSTELDRIMDTRSNSCFLIGAEPASPKTAVEIVVT